MKRSKRLKLKIFTKHQNNLRIGVEVGGKPHHVYISPNLLSKITKETLLFGSGMFQREIASRLKTSKKPKRKTKEA